jgi:hypothetical protein
MKARRTDDGKVAVRCPGCGNVHAMDSRWSFNGDLAKPTFSPSVNASHEARPEDGIPAYRCHSFILDGRIKFLSDCTHAFAGQSMELPEWENTNVG